jgi:hypothetical protein
LYKFTDWLPLYAATTLTASALETITEEAGVSPENSAKVQKNLDILGNVVSATSVGGVAALKGTRKAVLSAGTALVSKMAARATKKNNSEAEALQRIICFRQERARECLGRISHSNLGTLQLES